MKIDMFNHISPPRFFREMLACVPDGKDMQNRGRGVPMCDALEVTEDERDRIFRRNAETLMKLNGDAEAKPAAVR